MGSHWKAKEQIKPQQLQFVVSQFTLTGKL